MLSNQNLNIIFFHPNTRSFLRSLHFVNENKWIEIYDIGLWRYQMFLSASFSTQTKLERETILSHSITTDFSFFSHRKFFFLIFTAVSSSELSFFFFFYLFLQLFFPSLMCWIYFHHFFFLVFPANYVAQNYGIIIFKLQRRFTQQQSLRNDTLVTNIHYNFCCCSHPHLFCCENFVF